MVPLVTAKTFHKIVLEDLRRPEGIGLQRTLQVQRQEASPLTPEFTRMTKTLSRTSEYFLAFSRVQLLPIKIIGGTVAID